MDSSLLPIHVQPNLLVSLGNRHVAFGRIDDDRLSGGRRAELLGQVDGEGQNVAFDLHFYVLHGCPPLAI